MAKNNVVPLFPEAKPKEDRWAGVTTSPHFEEAWSHFPKEGKLRSSKKLAFAKWKKIAPQVGKDALVQAVRKYALEDKDAKSACGAPAFHRWLNWGRWEHWLPTEEQAPERVFPDAKVRADVVSHFGEGWVRSYLDRCDYVAGIVITKSQTAFSRLMQLEVMGLSVRLDS